MDKYKTFILSLAKTREFAIAGGMGIMGASQYLITYSPAQDKSNGAAFWIAIFALVLSTGYVLLFLFTKFLMKADTIEVQEETKK